MAKSPESVCLNPCGNQCKCLGNLSFIPLKAQKAEQVIKYCDKAMSNIQIAEAEFMKMKNTITDEALWCYRDACVY